MKCFEDKINRNDSRCAGFTLVEISIVILIVAIAGYAVVNTYTTLNKVIRENSTEINFNIIQDALSAYVDRNMRLPCPMRPTFAGMPEPMGYEAGSGVNGGNIPNNCPVLEGILPYATLGLTDQQIRDGYGHFITYRIARSHGRDPSAGAQVHENCRGRMWIETPMNSNANVNIHPELARFCCRASEGGVNDLDIEMRPQPAAGLQDVWRLPVDNGGARYGGVNTPSGTALPSNAVNRNTIRPIYVLVSHGEQGVGAFREDGSGARNAGFLGVDEAVNASTGSSRFAIRRTALQENDVTFFDDQVMWGTQDSLLARSGRFSCHAPHRD